MRDDEDLVFTRKRGVPNRGHDTQEVTELRVALRGARHSAHATQLHPAAATSRATDSAAMSPAHDYDGHETPPHHHIFQEHRTAEEQTPEQEQMEEQVVTQGQAKGQDMTQERTRVQEPALVREERIANDSTKQQTKEPPKQQSISAARYPTRQRTQRQTQPYSCHQEQERSTFGTYVLAQGKQTIDVPLAESIEQYGSSSLSDVDMGDEYLVPSDEETDVSMDDETDVSTDGEMDANLDDATDVNVTVTGRVKAEPDDTTIDSPTKDGNDQEATLEREQPIRSRHQRLKEDDPAGYQEKLRKNLERSRRNKKDPAKVAKKRAYGKKSYQKIMQDPSRHEKHKLRNRVNSKKRREIHHGEPKDPVKVAKDRARNKASYKKCKNDPVRWEERKARQRVNNARWLKKRNQTVTDNQADLEQDEDDDLVEGESGDEVD
ncbi:hypothetical protein M409DRAFT_19486 [Zasmidium cellare ATCC 36951]|uniref:Uncharacterized protein n=1 Tax=Zasmidium cellare ATCC 36951 TaxID=1080233 RepID=A0A6A6CWT8_ZASCE|nr:uncharacterized protein M409DRAFT_19486 [Zasmidium cellare ATCC 36951]KAF2170670.1 hypothetical protein M409DRAFT_19486 [Zasmidium cellare ATCC 36951]